MKEEDIGGPPIGLQPKAEDNDFSSGDFNLSNLEEESCGKDDGSGKGVNGGKSENAEAGIAYSDQPL